MSFDLIYKKTTGQIVRFGYDVRVRKGEAVLSFDAFTPFADYAVDVKKKVLVPATEKNAYRFEPGDEQLWEEVRERRDHALARTDFMMMPDYPISPEFREKIVAYRQALRDLTKDLDDPAKVVYPEFPAQT